MYICVYIYIYIYTYVHTCIYIYIYIYTYTARRSHREAAGEGLAYFLALASCSSTVSSYDSH